MRAAPALPLPNWLIVTLPLSCVLLVVLGLPTTESGMTAAGGFVLPLALLAATVVVYGAVVGDARATAVLIFVAVFLVEAIFRKRAYADKSIDFQVLVKVGLWLVMLMPVAMAVYRLRLERVVQAGLPWLLLYAWMTLTALWAPNPLYSLVAIASAWAYLCFFLIVFATYDRILVARVVIYGIAAFCLASLAVYAAVPALGRMPLYTTGDAILGTTQLTMRLTGLSSTANAAAFVSALSLLLGTVFWQRMRAMDGFIFYCALLVCAAVLLLSQSRVSLIGLLLCGLFYHYGSFRRAHLAAFAAGAVFVVAAILIPYGDDVLSLVSRSGRASEVLTLTGRSSLWPVVLDLIGRKPIEGWGYASSIFVLPNFSHQVGYNSVSQAHNLLLQLTLTTGLVGLLLFLVAAGHFVLRACAGGHREALTVFLFLMFVGLTEPGPFFGMVNAGVLALALAIGLATSPAGVAARRPRASYSLAA